MKLCLSFPAYTILIQLYGQQTRLRLIGATSPLIALLWKQLGRNPAIK